MSSSYYKGKIQEFTQMKASINAVSAMAPDSTAAIKKAGIYMEELIIGGEPIDKGVMSGDIASALSNATSLLSQLSSECDQLILKYTDLYNAALAEEQKNGTWKL